MYHHYLQCSLGVLLIYTSLCVRSHRFLLHLHCNKMDPNSRARPHTSPGLFHLDRSHSQSSTSLTMHCSRVHTPLVPSKTPTFCRTSNKSRKLFQRNGGKTTLRESASRGVSPRETITNRGESQRSQGIKSSLTFYGEKEFNAVRCRSGMKESSPVLRGGATSQPCMVDDGDTRNTGHYFGKETRQHWNDGTRDLSRRLPQSLRECYTCCMNKDAGTCNTVLLVNYMQCIAGPNHCIIMPMHVYRFACLIHHS